MPNQIGPRRSKKCCTRIGIAVLGLSLLSVNAVMPANFAKPTLTVLAAVSLTDALNEAGERFSERHRITVRHSFASSAHIARQLAAGAPADLFIAADTEWMDYAIKRKLVKAETRRVLAGNTLVIVAPANAIEPTRTADWPSALGSGRLVTGDPDSVPLGRYAREALQFLGLWSQLEPRMARAESARAALALVVRGEAPLGIVYASDALGESRVRVLSRIESRTHSAIVYPAAIVSGANLAATAYLKFLTSTDGQKIFQRHGFSRLGSERREAVQ